MNMPLRPLISIMVISAINADKVILKIPIFKDVVLAKNNYITMFGLAKLTASGVRMEQSLKLVYESTAPRIMKSDLEQAHKALKKRVRMDHENGKFASNGSCLSRHV
ncbi:hypothetical protein AB6D11_03060 [Vibrio splendidus]